jgi:hypothetical protein
MKRFAIGIVFDCDGGRQVERIGVLASESLPHTASDAAV